MYKTGWIEIINLFVPYRLHEDIEALQQGPQPGRNSVLKTGSMHRILKCFFQIWKEAWLLLQFRLPN